MSSKVYLFYRFFLSEIFSLKTTIIYILNFFRKVSIFKLIFFFLTKRKYPFRNNNINQYLSKNYEIWPNKKFINKKKILIDLTLGHPSYAIWNCLIMRELSYFYKTSNYLALVNRHDYLSYFIGKSFGIKNFIFINRGNFFTRIFYFFKAINLISEKNIEKKLIRLRYKKFAIGRAAYEFTIRNFKKKLFSTKENHYYFISIARALHSLDNHKDIFDKNIVAFVLSEIQYIPNRIFYNFATKNKIPIYAKIGGNIGEDISIRIYKKNSHASSIKGKFSNQIVDFLIKKSNNNFKKKINKYFLSNFNNSSKSIEFEKQYIKNNHLHKPQIIKFKNNSAFNSYFNLDNKKKNVLILPNVISDNSFTAEWNLFDTPLDWFVETLDKIKKIKNVNWIIKPHPSEGVYNSNLNIEKVFNKVISNNDENILLFKENLIVKDLYKHTHCILTAYGSAGYQYTSLGLPVITTADAPYSSFKFTYEPKNKNQYFNMIKKLPSIKKPNIEKIYRAKLYWYASDKIIRTKHNLVPLFDSHKNYDQNKFWELANKVNSIKNKKNNEFTKYFKIQLKNNNRHLINFTTIDKKNYENFRLNDT